MASKVCIGCEREQGKGHEGWCPVITGTLSSLADKPRKPTRLDRIEARHWILAAIETLRPYRDCLGDWNLDPVLDGWMPDLDCAIEHIETARKALHGQHTRGGTSVLADLGTAETRKPDTRPGVERRPERSA